MYNSLESIRDTFVKSSKDWGATKQDAWLYGIIVGWDWKSYKELSKMWNWSKDDVDLNKKLHQDFENKRLS